MPRSGWASNIRIISTDAAIKDIVDHSLKMKILKNARFNVFESEESSEVGLVEKVVKSLFKKPIVASPNKSELGGEKVLTVQYADTEHDTSVHLMHFGSDGAAESTQDKHQHPGPRFLSILAGKPWSLYIGEQMKELPEQGRLNMVKIDFPGDSLTTLEFRPKTLHGFQGSDLGAISFHWTDKQEALEYGVPVSKLTDKDVMENLTKVPDQSRIHLMESITYKQAQALKDAVVKR